MFFERRYNNLNLKVMFSNEISTLFVKNFYTSTKSWRGYIFTAVCLCVCVSVCPEILVNEIPAEQMHRFGRSFR